MIDEMMHGFRISLNNLLELFLPGLRFGVQRKSRNDGVHVGIEVVFTLPS
jgi:hypothetical protein